MSKYQQLINAIASQTSTPFRRASAEELSLLSSLGLPPSIMEFYSNHTPTTFVDGRVRLWTIPEILEENTRYVPGAYVAPFGYKVFGSTECGDAYCFDINQIDSRGEPTIVLISHEVISDDTTAEKVIRLAKPVATDLHDFLSKYTRGEVDDECIY